MTETVTPPASNTPVPATANTNGEQRELLKFLREEAEANRRAQREESDANRKLFFDISRIVGVVLAGALGLSAFLFYHDLNSMKDAMKAEGEESARAEIKKMDAHIDDTLQEQFKSDVIRETIHNAAVDATREQAPGLIKEVITPEVRKAVQGQSGTIRDVAVRAADVQMKGVIDPIVADVKAQALIAKANADDANAFDELLKLRSTAPPSQKELLNGVIGNLEQHTPDMTGNVSVSSSECSNPSGSSYQSLLASPQAAVRKTAIANCIAYASDGQWARQLPGSVSAFAVLETIAPVLMKVVLSDSSLTVRAEAVSAMNMLFSGADGVPNGGFDLLDTGALREWWAKHSKNQATIALIAFANGGPQTTQNMFRRDDQIGLYDEAQRLEESSSLRSALEQFRERMRKRASITTVSPEAQKREMMNRDCEAVARDLAIRMAGFRKNLDDERHDGYGLLELQYLNMSCSVRGQIINEVAEYGVVTRSMSTRYFAVEVVNKATGLSLDPYDSKPLKAWLEAHRQ